MGIVEGTCEYQLKRELPYKLNGGPEIATMVELREPGMEHVKFYMRLRQMSTQAQMGLAKHSDMIDKAVEAVGEIVKPLHEEDLGEIEKKAKGDQDIITMSLLASDVDISAFMTAFEKLACSHVKRSACMVGGKTPMTKALWGNLHPDDAFDMAVRWLSFFDTPSEEGQKTTSGQQPDSHMERAEV